MHQERSSYPKFPIHEKTFPAGDVVCWLGKLGGMGKRDQSLFSLLLEIESRVRTEARNNEIETLSDLKKKIAGVRESTISPVIASSLSLWLT